MVLAVQHDQPRAGDGVGGRLHRAVEPVGAVRAAQHEHRHGDLRQVVHRDPLVAREGEIVGERVSECLQARPRRRFLHHRDHLGGRLDDIGHPELHRVRPAPGRDQGGNPARRVLDQFPGPRNHERRLVSHDRGHRKAVRRGPQRERGSRRMPEDERPGPGCPGAGACGPGACRRLDHRGQVGHLAGGGVGLGVATVSPAAPVVGDDGELAGQAGGRHERLPVAERAEHDDQWRPVAGPVVGDDGAVGGLRGLHLTHSRCWLAGCADHMTTEPAGNHRPSVAGTQ